MKRAQQERKVKVKTIRLFKLHTLDFVHFSIAYFLLCVCVCLSLCLSSLPAVLAGARDPSTTVEI